MSGTRTERDSFGPIEVAAARLGGAQTERSRRFFRISGERMPLEVIHGLALIKKVAAAVNLELGLLQKSKSEGIQRAAGEGLANRASELRGGERGEKRLVRPNDDVNLGQSSNDVFPTAMHIAAARALHGDVLPAVEKLAASLAAKRDALAHIAKIGRTPLPDATPLTPGQ